jgi:tRNA-Thr(GGU) m(6)t(6)A37 methyltransferase TsaA
MNGQNKEIVLTPIGLIHSPYKKREEIPCQGYRAETKGTVEVFPQYAEGLKDVEGFSHLFLVYYFHKSERTTLVSKPFLDDKPKGIFAIRSPHRPNHLGLTIVKLLSIEKDKLIVANIDCLDGTPLLDIKPYVPQFDQKENVKIGWLEGKV